MLVAGSVLALLLMGLAVDGVMNPSDDPTDDDSGADNDTGGDEYEDVSGQSSGTLAEMLFGGEDADEDDNYDADEDRAEGEGTEDGTGQQPLATGAEADPENDFLEVEELTALEDGSDVPYVEEFFTDTDALVLEFDGTSDETPEIGVDHETEDGAALILANGVPVTLVEGAEAMTPDHVRVVMSDVPANDAPTQELPDLFTKEEASLEPVISETPDVAAGAPGKDDDDLAPVIAEDPADQSGKDGGMLDPLVSEGPQGEDDELGKSGGLFAHLSSPDASGTTGQAPDTGIILDPLAPIADTAIGTLDQIDDGLPTQSALDGLLDDITEGLLDDGMGGPDDALDVRGEMDDSFGTGGHDAIVGSFNNDALTGTDGQDALFGDEGDDTLDGGAGNDELHGDFGDDSLTGGDGIDYLRGGEGDDTLDGGADRDMLFGGDGNDSVYGGSADDVLQGAMGNDVLDGGSGNDVLDGTYQYNGTDMDASDTLIGGSGDDTLLVGQGDIAMGGAGEDVFVSGDHVSNGYSGTVTDFDASEDRIEVLYDPGQTPDPVLTVEDFSDGSGANILLNGEVILSVAGAQGLDPSLIDLRASA